MMAGEKPKEKHAMKYGFVLPLSVPWLLGFMRSMYEKR